MATDIRIKQALICAVKHATVYYKRKNTCNVMNTCYMHCTYTRAIRLAHSATKEQK